MTGTATTTGAVRLREGPSLKAKIIRVIPRGEKVKLLGYGEGQFVTAEYEGRWGVVSGVWLKDGIYDGDEDLLCVAASGSDDRPVAPRDEHDARCLRAVGLRPFGAVDPP